MVMGDEISLWEKCGWGWWYCDIEASDTFEKVSSRCCVLEDGVFTRGKGCEIRGLINMLKFQFLCLLFM